VLLIDRLCHASIIDAARASRAATRFFPHNDTHRLAELLERYAPGRRVCVVTEGLFSMDGDFSHLSEIASLKDRYQALLIVDDAHGTGVLGEHGRGTAELLSVESQVDITIATLSKAFGSLGGFVCCSNQFADYFRNRSRSYIYTTAAPAVMCLAAGAALEIICQEPQRRSSLTAVAKRLRHGLRRGGFDLGSAEAHIVPVILGRNELALQAAELLFQRGFLVPAIRQPSVPKGKARLRISLMSSHTAQDIDDLIEALVHIGQQLRLASGAAQAPNG
jgi:7-keto-8-aminopelargonate synthetase-like enzyme